MNINAKSYDTLVLAGATLVGAAIGGLASWAIAELFGDDRPKEAAADEPGMIGSWDLADYRENNEYIRHIPDELLGEHVTVLPDLYLEYVAEQHAYDTASVH